MVSQFIAFKIRKTQGYKTPNKAQLSNFTNHKLLRFGLCDFVLCLAFCRFVFLDISQTIVCFLNRPYIFLRLFTANFSGIFFPKNFDNILEFHNFRHLEKLS